MSAILLRIRTWWETADRTQRVVTVFGSLLLIAMVMGTIYLSSRPRMDVLYGGLSPADQGMLITELQSRGIPYRQDSQGNVLIPANQIVETRALLASAGKSPTSGHIGNESLTGIGVGTTPNVEAQRLRAALEGELARSIETFKGVQSARVHITLGNDSPFAAERRPPSASIAVTSDAGVGIGLAEGEAIARLVASGVAGMSASDVTVIKDGQILHDASSMAGAAGSADKRLQAQIAEQRRRATELQRNLDLVFGPGNTVVTVDLELDFDEKTTVSQERTPSETPVLSETNTETMRGTDMAAGALAGTPSNVPAQATPPSGGSSGQQYEGTRKALQFESNQRNTTNKEAAGDLLRMAINVVVDSATVTDVAKVTQYLQGYLGPLANDPRFTANVTAIEFDRKTQTESQKASAAAAGSQRIQQLISLLPIFALLFVGFLVVKSLGKVAQSQTVSIEALPDGRLAVQSGAPGGVGGALGSGSATAGIGGSPGAEGDLGEGGGGGGLLYRSTDGTTEIEVISEKVNVPLEQIKKMSLDRPSAVAMLVQSWMLEDRR
jgi:flagellar M-ring protein FliF